MRVFTPCPDGARRLVGKGCNTVALQSAVFCMPSLHPSIKPIPNHPHLQCPLASCGPRFAYEETLLFRPSQVSKLEPTVAVSYTSSLLLPIPGFGPQPNPSCPFGPALGCPGPRSQGGMVRGKTTTKIIFCESKIVKIWLVPTW